MEAYWRDCTAELGAAVDAVGTVSLACLPTAEASAFVGRLHQLRSRLDAVVGRALAERGGLAADDETGHRSVSTIVAAETRTSRKSVRAEQQIGGWVREYPVIGHAFAEGRISRDHVKAIRARENPRTRPHLAEAQQQLVEAATTCQWSEFLAVLRYWELAADPDGDEPEDQVRSRQFNYSKHPDGTVTGRFTLDPLAGDAMVRALESRVRALFRDDAAGESERTATQRRADALVDVVTGQNGASANAPLVHVVMSEQVAAAHFRALGDPGPLPRPLPLSFDDVDGRCELIDGTPLHPNFALAAMAEATFRRLVLGSGSERLDLGRAVRGFPPHLKEALLVRARGRCQQAGCDAPVGWLEADHLMPWSRGGSTSIGNGQILCDPHNKAKRDKPPPIR